MSNQMNNIRLISFRAESGRCSFSAQQRLDPKKRCYPCCFMVSIVQLRNALFLVVCQNQDLAAGRLNSGSDVRQNADAGQVCNGIAIAQIRFSIWRQGGKRQIVKYTRSEEHTSE